MSWIPFFGFKLPRGMHKEFADMIQKIAERQGEVAPEQIMEEFQKNYLDRKEPYHFKKVQDHRFRVCRRFHHRGRGHLYRPWSGKTV